MKNRLAPMSNSASVALTVRSNSRARSTASNPNRVVNLMMGFMATDEVSLNGSPTVSPTTTAACSSLPLACRSTSTTFLALSHAPPALAKKSAWNKPNRNQITHEEEWVDASEAEGPKQHGQEDVEHASLGVRRADFDHTLAFFHTRLGPLVELDRGLDELDGTVGSRDYSLGGGSGEPEDDSSADQEPNEKRWVQQTQPLEMRREACS